MKFKKLGILALSGAMLFACFAPSFAVTSGTDCTWHYNNTGWWLSYNDGSYAADTYEGVDGNEYYFDESGYMVTGWKFMNNHWHYFDPSGHMAYKGWQWIDGNCYFFMLTGDMASDTYILGSYVDSSGKWVRGTWHKDSNGWWYSRPDGKYPYDKFEFVDGKLYWFDENGYMGTGWFNLDPFTWKYAGADGAIVINDWVWIDGCCYFFDGDGIMATDEFIDGSYVDMSGKWIPDYSGQTQINKETDKILYDSDNFTVAYRGIMDIDVPMAEGSPSYAVLSCAVENKTDKTITVSHVNTFVNGKSDCLIDSRRRIAPGETVIRSWVVGIGFMESKDVDTIRTDFEFRDVSRGGADGVLLEKAESVNLNIEELNRLFLR